RVAVAEEPVAVPEGCAVRFKYKLPPCKGRNEHQERRARHVKIRHQGIRHAEFIARVYEEVRPAAYGGDCAVLSGGRFERPEDSGADGHDAPASGPRIVHHLRRFRRNLPPLRMDPVLLYVLGFYG